MTDSASKRKAAGPPDGESGSRSAKRQKAAGAPDGSSETAESTTEKGFDFIRTIKASKDKTGRSIIDQFLKLPDAKEVPGYYAQIKLPLAVETIEAKLERGEYASLTALESDFKRMVQNAKDFNDKRSVIYEDAERVRKGASNWFVRHNPAYNDRNYVAKPTPVPGETNGTPATPTPVSLRITNRSASSRTSAKVATPVPAAKEEEEEEAEAESGGQKLSDYRGKSFQKAQEQLIDELLDYEEPGGDIQIFTPFHFLPPRSLTDYYQVIKYPVSLKAVQKRVKGQHGRAAATGLSDFQSWDALEEELSYIWINCREYNEDGSDMYNLAGEFEDICKARLALARSQVDQPAQPKIKLNLGASAAPKQKIKLNFGSKASPGAQSPAGTPATERGTPGVIVDSDALQRQKEMVAASINGGRPSSAAGRNHLSRSASATTPVPGVAPRGSAASPPAHTNGVKAEGQSPALSAVRPITATASSIGVASMLPPGGVSRPVSGSPHPQLQPSLYQTAIANQYQPPPQANGFVQSKLRPSGQTVKDSILPSLTVISHPALQSSTPFKQIIKAHPRLIEQSFTYTVPASKHSFHIIPYLPPSVTSRAYRIFVLVNGLRLSPQSRPAGEDSDKSRPVYEARLDRGTVGRIEVEVLAEKKAGALVKGTGKDEVDREKVSVFVHVMRG